MRVRCSSLVLCLRNKDKILLLRCKEVTTECKILLLRCKEMTTECKILLLRCKEMTTECKRISKHIQVQVQYK